MHQTCVKLSLHMVLIMFYIYPFFSVIMALVFQFIDITGNWCIDEEKIHGFPQKLMTAP